MHKKMLEYRGLLKRFFKIVGNLPPLWFMSLNKFPPKRCAYLFSSCLSLCVSKMSTSPYYQGIETGEVKGSFKSHFLDETFGAEYPSALPNPWLGNL